uniref:Uncharacterized protein n=1 Tax=Boodleopsis pusilla TaxID=381415 RepID=A0A386AZG2_9CHLO|nr:hypothetical protein [Boodleopsis pusilla]AYC64834.1 hypothetical protein [Boodleopsis pusilla]
MNIETKLQAEIRRPFETDTSFNVFENDLAIEALQNETQLMAFQNAENLSDWSKNGGVFEPNPPFSSRSLGFADATPSNFANFTNTHWSGFKTSSDFGGGGGGQHFGTKGCGGGGFDGGDEGLRLSRNLIVYGALFLIMFRISQFILQKFSENLEDFEKWLQNFIREKPLDWRRQLYAGFARTVVVFMSLMTSPETFLRALRTFGNAWVRRLLSAGIFFFRCGLRVYFLGEVFCLWIGMNR